MVGIPLGIGAFTRQPANEPEVILKNMLVEKAISGAAETEVERLQRPGLANFRTVAAGSLNRGVHYTQGLFGSQPLSVIGTTLYKFTDTTSTSLGTVANDGGLVEFASTNFGTAILSAGVLYFHNQTILTTVAIPDSKIPVSITSINSYVIIACSDGTWFWLVPGDLTIDPLSFATAESMPDGLVACRALKGEVYFFGTSTMEVWQVTGDAALILTRANGREWDKGIMCRDTLRPFDNTMMFLGNDGIVYRVDGLPVRISNVGIEERIEGRTALPTALTYVMHGHAVYALHIPGVSTFAFDVVTGEWSEFTSLGGTTGWRPRTACALGTATLLGDSTSGKVFLLSATINTDDGVVFERAVSGTVPFHGSRYRNDNISVHVGTSGSATVRMRLKDGAKAWTDYRSQVAPSGSSILYFWRLGSALQPSRSVEFSCITDTVFRVSAAWANEGRNN